MPAVRLNPTLAEVDPTDQPQADVERSRRPAALVLLCVLLGPLALVLTIAIIAVALRAGGEDGDESSTVATGKTAAPRGRPVA